MSSATGKQILALVRRGEYAHAGEEEAIDLTLSGIGPSQGRKILDIGCGLGGTADYIARAGLGLVSGIDIDQSTIEYAKNRYPSHTFVCGPAGEASKYLERGFDLLLVFNAIYSFPDQGGALREAWKLGAPNAELRVFEYTSRSSTPEVESFCQQYGDGRWRPLVLDQAARLFETSGWCLQEVRDVTPRYDSWYQTLVHRIHESRTEIVARFGEQWFDYTLRRYEELLDAIRHNIVGGAIFKATKAHDAL